jgi:hypothetical protein
LPTEQEARDNPDLVISLDLTPPAGISTKPTLASRTAASPRLNSSPAIERPAPAPPKLVSAAPATSAEPPFDLPIANERAIPPTTRAPDPATVASAPSAAPVDLPPAPAPSPAPAPASAAEHRQHFVLPMPAEETARRTLPEGSRFVRDGRLVMDLLRWAGGNYLRNFKAFFFLTAVLVLPASTVESCLMAAALPPPPAAVVARLGTAVDFSERKAELAVRIRQAQTRGQVDDKAIAELAALSAVENAMVPLAPPEKEGTDDRIRVRLASLIQGFLLFGLALPLALAVLAFATVDQHGGIALPGMADVWPVLVGRAELFLVSLLPAAVLVAVGHALFVVPGLALSVLFIFLPHVVLFEKRGGRQAFARSVELLRTDARRVLLTSVVFGLAGFLAAVAAELLFPPSGSRAVVFVHFLLADGLAVLFLPIPAMVLARLYLDIRARTGSVAERLSRAARS